MIEKERIMKKTVIMTALVLIGCMCLSGAYLLKTEAAAVSAEGTVRRIVIDAGHGQPDGGAVGTTGIAEESVNLLIAQKLETLLCEDGWEVIMTRTDAKQIGEDKNSDMRRRREIIDSSGQMLTVSIHLNSFPSDADVSGPQVFYAPGSGQGKLLAEKIQSALNQKLEPAAPRTAAEGNYYIVKSGSVPAVIVECGFLSNPAEEQLLNRSQYQVRIAKAIAEGIAAYCG